KIGDSGKDGAGGNNRGSTLQKLTTGNLVGIVEMISHERNLLATGTETTEYKSLHLNEGVPQTRVEGITKCIAEQIGRQDRQKDRGAGQHDEPIRVIEIVLRVAEHVSPTRCRRLDTAIDE